MSVSYYAPSALSAFLTFDLAQHVSAIASHFGLGYPYFCAFSAEEMHLLIIVD
jgi:hypothetical protein